MLIFIRGYRGGETISVNPYCKNDARRKLFCCLARFLGSRNYFNYKKLKGLMV